MAGRVRDGHCKNMHLVNFKHPPCSWSYLINLTRIGNAVYVSMDIPDAFLAVRVLLT